MTRALAATLFAALVLIPAAGTHGIKEGGTFRVGIPSLGPFTTIDLDPAFGSTHLLRPACASLLNTPPKPPPAGLRYEPELAVDHPVVSKDGRMYTFTVRKDARFSNGAPVLAVDVKHSLERALILGPEKSLLATRLADLVGAQAIFDGKTTRLSGATARGRTLILRLRRRVVDFPIRASVCVVPASLPVDPEGVTPAIPSPAPYFVAQYVPNERVVLERNRFYTGRRPHHPTRFVVEMTFDAATIVDRVKSGDLELAGFAGFLWAPFLGGLAQRYGVNKSQFFSTPGSILRMFVLNTSRPLFKKNPKLRQAVNFAVNRTALNRELGPAAATPTDQYLPSVFPGFKDETIYPLKGPNLKMAKALSRGRTRDGKAVLYTCTSPTCVAQSQILVRNLAAIGLQVEIVQFPLLLLYEKLATDRASFDIGWRGVVMGGPEDVGTLFDGRTVGLPENANYSYFDSPTFNRLIATAAALPLGRAREDAYGELDVRLSRDAAPAVAFGVLNEVTFVSAKVGCIVLNPGVDITAVCLK